MTPTATPARSFPKSDYKDYPRTLDPDDLWGQVRRTVNGQPVGEDQIALIVQALRSGLALRPDDVLLDLACGNGALTSYLFDDCAQVHGVDHSEYLIEVAQRRFAQPGRISFEVDDVAAWVARAPAPERFTVALCYGSFMFFPAEAARATLAGLHQRFVGVRRILLGNLPDRDRADRFYPAGRDFRAELDDPAAQIGLWRSEAQLRALAEATGWRLRLQHMPAAFYAAHYRFDAVLERAD